jgi:hypothetical protein
MNERIRQLAEQASNEYLSEMEPVTDTLSTAKRDELAQKAKQAGIGIIPHGFSEKFAQLIVRECLEELRYAVLDTQELRRDKSTDYQVGWEDGMFDAGETIKNIFGVEE